MFEGWKGMGKLRKPRERRIQVVEFEKIFLELTRLELQMLLQEGPEEKRRTRDQHSSIQPCLVASKHSGNSSLHLSS